MRLPEATDADTFALILAGTQRQVTSRVSVLDRDERPAGSTVPVTAGKVSVDASADVTRSCELTAIDPDRKLGFDAGTPGAGALYADRMIQVDYGMADSSGEVRWTPVFRGPIARYDRAHPEVTIAAQGKDALGLAPNLPLFKGQALVIPSGRRLDAAFAAIADALGERFTDIPILRRTVGRRIALGRTKEPWRTLKALAADNGLDAFYDGAGVLRVRQPPPRPVWIFEADVLTWPRVTYDLGGEFRNIVRVVGKRKAGRRSAPPSHTAEPPPADPLSPRSLARNGHPRYIAEYMEVEATDARVVRNIAERELARRMRQSVTVEFESMTVPGLEEDDPCAVVLPGERNAVSFAARTFGLDLGTDQMTIGTTSMVHVRRIT
jgi:hypothetical protein